ncbi:11176_t:CDS:2, partial [Funneliformis caledonium]
SPNIEEYEHSFFEDIRPIGKGSFGSVVRVNLKNTDDLYALKSLNTDKVTLHEIVNELKIHRKVHLHKNIIKVFGIIKEET